MHPTTRASIVVALLCVLTPVVPLAQSPKQQAKPPAASSELDAFMEKVLARRDVNRQMLNDYILDEVERFELLGPGQYALMRMNREFTWYVRDGMHVRSPVRFDGVAVNEQERKRYEETWIRRERERRENAKRKGRERTQVTATGSGVTVEKGADSKPTEQKADPSSGEQGAEGKALNTPRFVSEAYFMDFKFEPGNYYLAGREQLEGHDVLRIEYYPTRLFSDDEHDRDKGGDADQPKEPKKGTKEASQREKREGEQIQRRMNKTAMVTLWVDPSEYQIVKYTFDNVWLDFLPGAWLVRVDDLRASMTMGQPFPGVWLPRDMKIHAGITLANGSFEAAYSRAFSDYREADVKTRIRIPKSAEFQAPVAEPGTKNRDSRLTTPDSRITTPNSPLRNPDSPVSDQHGPYVQEPAQVEVIREIRVHGNAFLTDEEVIALAGVAVGQPLEAGTINSVEQRLKSSKRFESIDVRKRYRSLTDTSDIALVLVVHERPGVRSGPNGKPVSRPLGRLTDRLMFLPILGFADGYGFTYGGRVSTVNLLGIGERLSVPLTWGGTRRAALEFERVFKRGPITRIQSSAAIWRRENPHFEIGDRRLEVSARAERQFARIVRTGVEASRSAVRFGQFHDSLWTVGANVVLDTASDPAYPANAVWLGAGWTGLHVKPGASDTLPRIDEYTTEARGYLRVVRQVVAAGRVQYTTADAMLPPYERLLLGGASSLRGFRAGLFDGDRLLITSAELRVPITTVLSSAKFGFTGFFDAGKTSNFDQSLQDAVWHKGIGGGIFIIAPLVRINLDLARGLKDGGTRLHLSAGFMF